MTTEPNEPVADPELAWMTDSPRRFGAGVAAATVALDDGRVMPALTFIFASTPDSGDDPITVTLIAEEVVLRGMQKALDKAITAALRAKADQLGQRNTTNGKGRLWTPPN